MAQGQRTPDDVRLRFAEKYLEIGSARGSARAIGIPETTGCDLARELEKDEAFVQRRAEQRARCLQEVENRLLSLADTVHARIERPDPEPEDLARLAVEHGLKSFSYQNPKPQYLKGLVDFYKAVAAQRKGEVDRTPSGASQRIEVVFTDGIDAESA